MIDEFKSFKGEKLILRNDAFLPLVIKIKAYLKDKFFLKFQDPEYF